MSVQNQSDATTALCTSCGMCCDGSLHDHAVLREEELDSARALGLHLLGDGRRGFAMPCAKLADRCCTIYAKRPSSCRGYKCQLLYDLEADQVSLDEALRTVRDALDLGAQCATDGAATPGANQRETAQRKLRLTSFRLFLDRHFRNTYEGPMVHQETVGDGREGAAS